MLNQISLIKKGRHYLEEKGALFFSRSRAKMLKEKVTNKKGYQVVGRKEKKMLKSYAKNTFGSTSFWPWLALYVEIKEEFKIGWLPDDYYMVKLLKKYNPESIRISDYKTFDNKLFPDFALSPLIIKIGENFYDANRKKITVDRAVCILREYDKEVVLKEDLGLGGHQVKFINSKKLNFENYSHITSYIIQPVLKQHKNLRVLNSNAVSTTRVLTYLNGEGNVEVKYAYLRFGVGDSRVDNVSSGGGFCFVNPDGTLDKVAYDKLGLSIGESHPHSGIPFKSVTIPCYKKLLQKCIDSHNKFPYAKFIGWDVTVNIKGKPTLLEWNLKPLIWLAEALHGPFFKEEIMKKEIVN